MFDKEMFLEYNFRCWNRVVKYLENQKRSYLQPFRDEAQTALFKDPVRTAL